MLSLAVGGEFFGLDAGMVLEVARMPRLARVPHAPPALLGLANIRGEVVPVLSLAILLQRASGEESRVVIIDNGERVGLAVDDVARLVDADDAGAATVQCIDVAALVAQAVTVGSRQPSRARAMADLFEVAAEQANLLSLIIFGLGGQEFALPLSVVQEVRRRPSDVTIMPHADDAIVGSIAVRGALLPLLSLRALLAFAPSETGASERVVIVCIGSHRIGLVVDAIRSALRVPETDIDPVPQVLTRGEAEARIQAVLRLDDGKRLVSVLATEHLLRDDITARLLQGASEGDRIMSETRANDASEQFLLFRIGDEEFGLPIAAVEEVASLPAKLARLPKAPAFVKGVMNLRGTVIPVIDQVARFGGSAETGGKRRVVVVRIGELQAGFVVDGVSEVLRIARDALGPAPDLGREETRVFERVANLSGQHGIVLIVSPRELLDRAEQDLLRRSLAKSSVGAA